MKNKRKIPGKHKCQICAREIDDAVGLAHIKKEGGRDVLWSL